MIKRNIVAVPPTSIFRISVDGKKAELTEMLVSYIVE
jgi:hypothetical protein